MVDCVLHQMELASFRSFSLTDVFFANPTFVVGQNGSGKSNFTDAFAFLSEAMASPLQAVIERRGGFSTVSYRSSATGRPVSLTLEMRLSKPDANTECARYRIALLPRRGHDFEVAHEHCAVVRSDGRRDWFTRRTTKGSTNWRSSVKSLLPSIEPRALVLPLIGGDRRFSTMFRFLAGMRVYGIEPDKLRAMQDPDSGSSLQSDGRNSASVLREIRRQSPKEDWTRFCELLESVVPGTIGVQPKEHGNKLTLEFTQVWAEGEPIQFEAHSMSDGTLRALGLIAAVFQRRKPSLLVVEEPEASIHPGAIGVIIDVLRLAGRSMQVVVSTQSPDVLDAAWIKDQHLRIVTWKRGLSRISRVSKAVQTALGQRIMGAGELLRSNALTPEPPVNPNSHQSCIR